MIGQQDIEDSQWEEKTNYIKKWKTTRGNCLYSWQKLLPHYPGSSEQRSKSLRWNDDDDDEDGGEGEQERNVDDGRRLAADVAAVVAVGLRHLVAGELLDGQDNLDNEVDEDPSDEGVS